MMDVIGSLRAGGSSMVTKQEGLNDDFGTDEVAVELEAQGAGGSSGGIAYKVVQVGADGQLMTTNISTPSGVGSPSQQVYIPLSMSESLSASAPAANVDVQTASSLGPITQVSTPGGQLYVMMSPQEVLSTQRTIAPRTGLHQVKVDHIGGRTARDERRRHTHNEVERRRRDKINNLIVSLSKIVPDCSHDANKQGQVSSSSKGTILAKTCSFIQELRNENARLQETVKQVERMTHETELLRQQLDEVKAENEFLKVQMQQHGIEVKMFGDS